MSAVVSATLFAACGGPPPGPAAPEAGPPRPVVAVTVAPLAWFVERLAGDAVEVAVLVPPGASPETFEPSVRERRSLDRATLLVEVGHPAFALEAVWVAPLVRDRHDLRITPAWSPDDGEDGDPHVWLSPAVALDLTDDLAASLSRLVPSEAEAIEARRRAVRDEIERLDREIAAALAPYRGRRFYVFHPAWGAFAARYDLVQEAVEEHGGEPGPDHLAELVDLARRDRASTVFVQPQFAERGIRVLADEIGARVEVLDPLDPDWAAGMRRAAEALAASFAGEDRPQP